MNPHDVDTCPMNATEMSPAVARHMSQCARCSASLRRCEDRAIEPGPSRERLAVIRGLIVGDLQPVTPLASAPALLLRLLALATILALVSGILLGGRGWHAMTAEARASFFVPLLATASISAYSVVKHMSPTARPDWRPIVWAFLGFVMCSAFITELFGLHAGTQSVALGMRCSSRGLVQLATAAIILSFVVRRGAHWSAVISWASLGSLAGLSAMAGGQFRCPNPDRLHVLLAHASLPLIGADRSAVVAGIAQTRKPRSTLSYD